MKFTGLAWRREKGIAAVRRKAASNLYLIDGRYVTMADAARECGISRTAATHRHRRLVAKGEKITMAALRGEA